MSFKVFRCFVKANDFSRLICLPMFVRYTMWWSMGSLGLAFVFTWYQSKCHWLELIWLAFRSFARGGQYWSWYFSIKYSNILIPISRIEIPWTHSSCKYCWFSIVVVGTKQGCIVNPMLRLTSLKFWIRRSRALYKYCFYHVVDAMMLLVS